MEKRILVIGAGLAGTEVANYLANSGIQVVLAENKTIKRNPAQKTDLFAELVCTNSLKSQRPESAHGILKHEMRLLGSLVLEVAEQCAVPAGDALAVDREKFSSLISEKLRNHKNIQVVEREISNPIAALEEYKCQKCVVATGPLTTPGLEKWLQDEIFSEDLYFYDAIAPVVDSDTLDFSKLYAKDRYKDTCPEEAAYINVPLEENEYYEFVDEIIRADKVSSKDFEDFKFFEACLPIDVMCERGRDTARFSCMKPVGLERPDGSRPFAVVQLRKENLLGSAFNLVGFQTKLTYPEQKRIFRMLPGFSEAEFLHLGSVHRNTYINSSKLLELDLSSKKYPQLHFAGQITGVEGYTESAMCGLYVAEQLIRILSGQEIRRWPIETAFGALVNYIMTADKVRPTNVHFGLFPPVELAIKKRLRPREKKKIRQQLICQRAMESSANYLGKGLCSV